VRRRWEERRQQDGAVQPEQEPQVEQQEERDTRRRRWEDRRAEDRGSQDRRQRWEQWRQQAADGRPMRRPPAEDPTGSWARYVRDFIRWYNLDASQQATAESVLRTMQESRSNYERASTTEFEAARGVADRTVRDQRLVTLNEPVVRMFGELKSQLERIPSAAQRDAIRGSGAATEPAAESGEEATTRRTPQRERDGGGEGRDRGPRARGRR
jgi:hypothetical protein